MLHRPRQLALLWKLFSLTTLFLADLVFFLRPFFSIQFMEAKQEGSRQVLEGP